MLTVTKFMFIMVAIIYYTPGYFKSQALVSSHKMVCLRESTILMASRSTYSYQSPFQIIKLRQLLT